ncbi:MAG TPA: hypothetical protein VF796_25240 [Humisphaera sp.]
MPSASPKLKTAWEAYLRDADPATLAEAVAADADARAPCDHPFPWAHRLSDVTLHGTPYRVMRCAACDEALFFFPIPPDRAGGESGVPYWVTGRQLRRWADDRAEQDRRWGAATEAALAEQRRRYEESVARGRPDPNLLTDDSGLPPTTHTPTDWERYR